MMQNQGKVEGTYRGSPCYTRALEVKVTMEYHGNSQSIGGGGEKNVSKLDGDETLFKLKTL